MSGYVGTNEFQVGDVVSLTGTVTGVSNEMINLGHGWRDEKGFVLVSRPEPTYTVELTQAELNAIKDCVGLTPTPKTAMSSVNHDALYEKLLEIAR